jgi:hypothetical protein
MRTENATLDASSGGGTITRTSTDHRDAGTSQHSPERSEPGDTASVDVSTFTNTGSGTRTVNLGVGI